MEMKRRSNPRRSWWLSTSSCLAWWQLVVVLFVGGSIWLFVPQESFAQANLQASMPQQDAVLPVAPRQVHLWMSEQLSSSFSSVVVANERNQRIEVGSSQVVGQGARELEVGLPPFLAPGLYIVAWHVASAVDGLVTAGSFQFTISTPSTTLPRLNNVYRSSYVDLFQGSTLLLVGATVMMEVGVVFWTGAALWSGLLLSAEEEPETYQGLIGALQRRFEQQWAWLTIALLCLSQLVWIVAHLMVSGVDVASFSLATLVSSVMGETAGQVWGGQVVLLLLALRLSVFRVQQPVRSLRVTMLLIWGDLLLGLGLCALLALSSQSVAPTPGHGVLLVFLAWLQLLAAAFGVGGILFLASCYVPLLPHHERDAHVRFFMTTLPASSLWGLSGLLLLAVTSSLLATTSIQQWSDLLTTSYGVVLVSQSVLVGMLLLMYVLVMLRFQPRFRQTWERYCLLRQHISPHEPVPHQPEVSQHLNTRQITSQKILLVKQIQQMRYIIWIEAGIGVGILICAGLLTVLAQSLS